MPGEPGLPVHCAAGGGLPAQQAQGFTGVKSHTDSLDCDILEQSLRAADVLADYPNSAGLSLQPRSLPLACTATSSIASGLPHPLGSAVDCALDFSQQQRLNRRRTNNNNNNNNTLVHAGRHSLSDIVTPTSDVTTASSPSESFSQVNGCLFFLIYLFVCLFVICSFVCLLASLLPCLFVCFFLSFSVCLSSCHTISLSQQEISELFVFFGVRFASLL